MMTKLIQEAVTEVASCGVMNRPTTWIFLMGSLMILANAAYTASLYAITPIIQATIREICEEQTEGRTLSTGREGADPRTQVRTEPYPEENSGSGQAETSTPAGDGEIWLHFLQLQTCCSYFVCGHMFGD